MRNKVLFRMLRRSLRYLSSEELFAKEAKFGKGFSTFSYIMNFQKLQLIEILIKIYLYLQELIKRATNYAPIKVAISRAEGVNVWDAEGKQYFDFLSAYSAVNQGHGHPKIIEAAVEQMRV